MPGFRDSPEAQLERMSRAETRLAHWRETYRFWVKEHHRAGDPEAYALTQQAWVAIARMEKEIVLLRHAAQQREERAKRAVQAAITTVI